MSYNVTNHAQVGPTRRGLSPDVYAGRDYQLRSAKPRFAADWCGEAVPEEMA